MSMTRSICSSPSMRSARCRLDARAVQARGGVAEERVDDQRGLARAGHAGDAGEEPERDSARSRSSGCCRVRPRCVIWRAGSGPHAQRRQRDAAPPREVLAGDRGGVASMSRGVPCATRWPPCAPAPGPRSMTWSASRMASSSCSTTITVLPRSRSCLSVPSRRWLSRWCRPIEGSSRMYMTPVRPEPTWLARRMRWDFPARERLGAAVERQVVEAHVLQEPQPLAHAP